MGQGGGVSCCSRGHQIYGVLREASLLLLFRFSRAFHFSRAYFLPHPIQSAQNAKILGRVTKGGSKNFDASLIRGGGQKILDRQLFWIPWGSISNKYALEKLGKNKVIRERYSNFRYFSSPKAPQPIKMKLP